MECPKCGALFYSEKDLESHFSAWHKPGGHYYAVCPKCGKKFGSERELREHLRTHPSPKSEGVRLLERFSDSPLNLDVS